MTTPLTGQRSRSDLIAELYERHAAGLFAYCHDQLGETASAADALVAVFTGVPPTDPPRAALFSLARREIYRRDVSYAMPAVDSIADPATALIERVFRDIRPHQREVLLLSAHCGLSAAELALVLDVAADTAEELATSARHRFGQTLATAVAAARTAPFIARDVEEVYDAIGVAPLEDVLARLPWREPPHDVLRRLHQSALPFDQAPPVRRKSSLPVRKLWPTAPSWPLPLATETDPATNTTVVPIDDLTNPTKRAERRRRHEALTEPMPRLRGSILKNIGNGPPKRRMSMPAPQAAPAPPETVEAVEAVVEDQLAAFSKMSSFDGFTTETEHPAPKPAETELPPSDAPAPEAAGPSADTSADVSRDEPETPGETTMPDLLPSDRLVFAKPLAADDDLPQGSTTIDQPEGALVRAVQTGSLPEAPIDLPPLLPARSHSGRRAPKPKPERHHDWAWELIGFLICLVIALAVFFSMPLLV
ncbi:RNA polymerase sigma factor [Herbidospora yilanensis]|uniref:RNA polymerase sigma factor n=1 Tax=Herbidospora yilanensis TaxID=354426 RepID=UPI000780253B|nr:sigma-70 family RNA polymerase sigma factor [Herbidospora yilanensis]